MVEGIQHADLLKNHYQEMAAFVIWFHKEISHKPHSEIDPYFWAIVASKVLKECFKDGTHQLTGYDFVATEHDGESQEMLKLLTIQIQSRILNKILEIQSGISIRSDNS